MTGPAIDSQQAIQKYQSLLGLRDLATTEAARDEYDILARLAWAEWLASNRADDLQERAFPDGVR